MADWPCGPSWARPVANGTRYLKAASWDGVGGSVTAVDFGIGAGFVSWTGTDVAGLADSGFGFGSGKATDLGSDTMTGVIGRYAGAVIIVFGVG